VIGGILIFHNQEANRTNLISVQMLLIMISLALLVLTQGPYKGGVEIIIGDRNGLDYLSGSRTQ